MYINLIERGEHSRSDKNACTHTQLDPQPQTYCKLTYSLNKVSPMYIQYDKKNVMNEKALAIGLI